MSIRKRAWLYLLESGSPHSIADLVDQTLALTGSVSARDAVLRRQFAAMLKTGQVAQRRNGKQVYWLVDGHCKIPPNITVDDIITKGYHAHN